MGILHEDIYIYGNISVLLRIRNISNKPVDKIKTHFLCSLTFFPEHCVIYEINVEKYCTVRQAAGDNMIRHMHITYWITKD
jgi:hypothetical protein